MLRKSFACGIIDGSMPIRRNIQPEIRMPTILISIDEAKMKIYKVLMAFLTFTISFAPKYWETIIVNPIVMPMNREISKKVIGMEVPTAARACFPMNLPTMMLSIRL